MGSDGMETPSRICHQLGSTKEYGSSRLPSTGFTGRLSMRS
jgi:hypothetical protein